MIDIHGEWRDCLGCSVTKRVSGYRGRGEGRMVLEQVSFCIKVFTIVVFRTKCFSAYQSSLKFSKGLSKRVIFITDITSYLINNNFSTSELQTSQFNVVDNDLYIWLSNLSITFSYTQIEIVCLKMVG